MSGCQGETRAYIVSSIDDEVQIIAKPKKAKAKTARAKEMMKYDDKNLKQLLSDPLGSEDEDA